MSFTFLETPLRWQSAQLPVLFTFEFEIELPVPVVGSPDFIGSFLEQNNAGKSQIVMPLVDDVLQVGQSFYIASGTGLKYKNPVTVVSRELLTIGGADYVGYTTTQDATGTAFVNLYTLSYVEQYNPTLRLFVRDIDQGGIRYDPQLDGTYRVNLSPYLRRNFREIGFPGLVNGEEPNLYASYRLDYSINGEITTGTTLYCLNSMIQPENPSCSNNLPIWQFDLSTLQCQYTSPRLNANRVARMKDINPDSPTFNTYRDSGFLFYYDSNSAACPVTFSNQERTGQFRKQGCSAGSIGTLETYVVPAGTFTSLISIADANAQADADISTHGQLYANAEGTCVITSAEVQYRDLEFDYSLMDVEMVYANVYIIYTAGGPVDVSYDILDTTNGTPVTTTGFSANISGTEVQIADHVLISQTSTGYTFNREYINLIVTA